MFALDAIAPNPARGRAVFAYDVPAEGGAVRLVLTTSVAVPPGLYLARMQAAGFRATHKLLMTT